MRRAGRAGRARDQQEPLVSGTQTQLLLLAFALVVVALMWLDG
jgi:hypothetical protein